MNLKSSNLCLSADVDSASTLLDLADTIGPSIVVLKTHYDTVDDWDFNPRSGTGAKLAALARRHGFLVFEDRKLGDIGSTVQKQYVGGRSHIIDWAHITNANISPGPAIVTALEEAAGKWQERKRYEVKTDIYAGTPRPESRSSVDDEEARSDGDDDEQYAGTDAGRKGSIVSVTTVSQHYESADAARSAYAEDAFPGIEEAPIERGLLLLAQMSSAGNTCTGAYTDLCVKTAREHSKFVMGFICQESLNTDPNDMFISMTPGCQLPPPGEDEDAKLDGDGLGQQYNTPKRLVGKGCDVVIVGRGIIKAHDPVAEAQRYQIRAWKAYEERVDGK